MRKILWAALASSLLTAGCGADLMVPKYDGNQSKGFFYALPKADVSVEVTRRIVTCEIGLDKDGKRHVTFGTVDATQPLYVLEIETTAKIESRVVVDPDHGYVIDYAGSSNWLKTADISIERYPSGALKSLNSSITDTTDKVIVGTVTLVAKAALMGSGGFGALPSIPMTLTEQGGASAPRNTDARLGKVQELCNEPILEALKNLKTVGDARKTLVRFRSEETTKLSDLLRAKAPSETRSASEIEASIKVLDARIAAADRAIAVLNANLSDTTSYSLFGKDAAAPISSFDLELAPATRDGWFSRVGLVCLNSFVVGKSGDELGACTSGTGSGTVPIPAQAVVEIQPLGGIANSVEITDATKKGTNGVMYREPVNVLLTVLQGPSDATARQAIPPQTVTQARVVVPQLGALVYLPLHNGAFASNTLAATFAENGSLLTARYTSAAQAEKALGTLNQSLDIVAKQQDAKRNASLNELKFETDRLKAENALIDAQTENLKKLQTLRDLRN